MHILNVGYDSTNYYVLADSQPRLLIDIGFAGTLPKLQHQRKRIGIQLADIKHLLATHYHSDDSVTLITDDGAAFTGDLTHPMLAGESNADILKQSWDAIRAHGGKISYPGHGPVYHLE